MLPIAGRDFVLGEVTILHMHLLHLSRVFFSLHHYPSVQGRILDVFVFLFLPHLDWPIHPFSLPPPPSPCPLAAWTPSTSSRHTGQIWIVLMCLNRHTQWEKPLLLTAARGQPADIGVSFCEWKPNRSLQIRQLERSTCIISFLVAHVYMACLFGSDKPGQPLLGLFRCRGSLLTAIKVTLKHLPCNHFDTVECWAFLSLFTSHCALTSHSLYHALNSRTVEIQPCLWLFYRILYCLFVCWFSFSYGYLLLCAVPKRAQWSAKPSLNIHFAGVSCVFVCSSVIHKNNREDAAVRVRERDVIPESCVSFSMCERY